MQLLDGAGGDAGKRDGAAGATVVAAGATAQPLHHLAEDFARCECTAADLLSDELTKSELSGRQYRKDQQAVCAVSGTAGHVSEFIRCQETKSLVAPDQTDVSAVSKLRVRRDLLLRSEKPPQRLG